jgi:hypothetical protein
MMKPLVVLILAAFVATASTLASEYCEGPQCRAKSALISSMKTIHHSGVRPRWSPDGARITFDRRNAAQWYNVFLSDRDGKILASLTEGKQGISAKNHGNAVFHPKAPFIVFVSQEQEHMLDFKPAMGDPGIGLFSNLVATDPAGRAFWNLTDIPIRKRLMFDKTPAYASVNPHFDVTGDRLFWTERYAEGPTRKSWGMWRIKMADFGVRDGQPVLSNVAAVPIPMTGNYVTSMGMLDAHTVLLAGNLDGQHEYGMDQYAYDLRSGALTNLTKTPDIWEEGACASPSGGQIVYMSNASSPAMLDFSKDWVAQSPEREYWIMDRTGANKRRLTYFNDRTAPEYLGKRVMVAACDISPDGRTLAATVGVDMGGQGELGLSLKVVLIEFARALE